MPGRPPQRQEGADDDGARLWRRATADAIPLRRRAGDIPPPLAPPPRGQPAAAKSLRPLAPPPYTAVTPVQPPDRPPLHVLEPGVAPGIDARTLIRLRRGLIPPEARVDLHYCTQDDAHRLLFGFLAASQAASRRCVLVITGKGFGTEGRVGVLKAAVPRWLNESPNRERVLAFTHATAAFGGEGALFVLLRRPRREKR